MNQIEASPELTEIVEPHGHASGAQWLSRYSSALLGCVRHPAARPGARRRLPRLGRRRQGVPGPARRDRCERARPRTPVRHLRDLQPARHPGHVSNFFTSPTQVALAEKLLEISNAPAGSRVFFANSGTEAVEAAFKLARRNAGSPDAPRTKIIALEGAFHGRTMGALALTSKEAYRAPFAPLPGGVVHVPFGDIEALRAAIDDTTAPFFLEPIQGEAGVRPLPAGYLQAAREATTAAGALLILDEVQTASDVPASGWPARTPGSSPTR